MKLHISALRAYWRQVHTTTKIVAGFGLIVLYVAAAVIIGHHLDDPTVEFLNRLADLSLLVIAIPVGFFYLGFLLFLTGWAVNPAGKSVAVLGIALVILLCVNAASLFLGQEYPGRPLIRDASYLGLCAAVIYLAYTVVQLSASDAIRRLELARLASMDQGESDLVSK